MTNPNPAPSKSPSPLEVRAPQAPPAPAGDEFAQLLQAIPEKTSAQTAKEGTEPVNAATGGKAQAADSNDTIEVDWRGAKKRVSQAELVRRAMAQEEAEAKARVLEEHLQKNAAAKGFMDQLDQMAPEDREAFAKVLANPKLAKSLVTPTQPAGDSESDDDIDATLSGRQAAAPRQDDDKIAVLERGMKVLLEREARREQETRQQTMARQLDEAMKAYPVFEENPSATKFARGAIAAKLAANPRISVDDIVAEHAAQVHEILQGERRAYVSNGNAAPRNRIPQLQDESKPPTGDDLRSGRLGKDLQRMLRNGQF